MTKTGQSSAFVNWVKKIASSCASIVTTKSNETPSQKPQERSIKSEKVTIKCNGSGVGCGVILLIFLVFIAAANSCTTSTTILRTVRDIEERLYKLEKTQESNSTNIHSNNSKTRLRPEDVPTNAYVGLEYLFNKYKMAYKLVHFSVQDSTFCDRTEIGYTFVAAKDPKSYGVLKGDALFGVVCTNDHASVEKVVYISNSHGKQELKILRTYE